MIVKQKRCLHNEKGELSYISSAVFILIGVLVLVVIIDVMSIIMTKQKIDTAADQMVRQIQLAGKVDSDTDSLIGYLADDLAKVENLSYFVDTEYITKDGCDKVIQLGTPFYLTVTAEVQLGGFWSLTGAPITLQSHCTGVSERYWK